MNFKLRYLSVVIGLSLASGPLLADHTPQTSSTVVTDIDSESAVRTLKNILANDTSYNLRGNEDFTVLKSWVDDLGKRHTKYEQRIDGIKVYGSSITIHADENSIGSNGFTAKSASSDVYFISGGIAENTTDNVASFRTQSQLDEAASLAAANVIGEIVSDAELAYVFLPLQQETKLAYRIEVKYYTNAGLAHDVIYFDAYSAEELTRDALVFHSKKLKTYLMHNKKYSDRSRPGTLNCSTGQKCSDASAQRAHSGAAKVYDFYKEKLGRNGIDNRNMTMISSVHTGNRWNNAVWYNNQMFYGDGDGKQFTDFTKSFDIIAHELTHGVTQNTANLAYKNASGALNEAWSDILGAAAEAFNRGSLQPNWNIGGLSYTPNKAGDALRYMKNPTKDGYSKDYYPERISFTNNPSQQNDRGGVHGNSGIANLAFALLVDGGSHPRNKTSVTVPKLGLEKAQKIFYRALTTYFNASTNFFQAKTGTAQAAQDLYGADEKAAVEAAWCAVGVGKCNTTKPTPNKHILKNGVTERGLAASKGSELVYTMQVPANAQNISFSTSGGTGDADLYVRFARAATDKSYDCAPRLSGNAETCNGTKSNGTYYVRLKAYKSFSNVSLAGSYSTTNPKPTSVPTKEPTPTGSWDANKSYPPGKIVTYAGKSYKSLWWNKGQEPGSKKWGPWELLTTTGPTPVPTTVPTAVPTTVPTAVPTAVPTVVPTAVPTTAPTPTGSWNANKAYPAGKIVTHAGKSYKSLWWNKGQEPGTIQWGPWELLTSTTTEPTPKPGPTSEPNPGPTPKPSPGTCADIAPFNANESWHSYSVGDKRSYNNFVWSVVNVAYSTYTPDSSFGRYGWKKESACPK
ncbi:MAG: hypothetical protein GY787_31320 [Alteromonadales bacterium]|nr:hypothetical protein [Alteromonadales bacterium]